MNKKDNFVNQQPTYDIYVANVPKYIKEAEFERIFQKYGEIKQVLCRWKDDYIGYGIVKFIHKLDADNLLKEIDEVYFNGQIMPIKAARRSDSSQSDAASMSNNTKPDKKRNQQFPPPLLPLKPDFGYFQKMNYVEHVNTSSQPMMMEVLCTNVENAVTFHGFPASRLDELAHFSNTLNNFAITTWSSNKNKNERRLYSQRVYAAVYSQDSTWYRCVVIRSNIADKPGYCTVRYIDYGNQEDILIKNIIDLPESLQKVPPFAWKFYLHNLKCESQQENKPSYLHQLVNKRMTLCAIASVAREYQVVKCTCDGKDVISEIVKKGLAKHTNQINQQSSKNKVTQSGGNLKNKNNGPSIPPPVPIPTTSNSIVKPRRAPKGKEEKEKSVDNQHNRVGDKQDSEFHPKRIIKRGELSEVIGLKPPHVVSEAENESPILVPTVERRPQPTVSMMDTVIGNLKLINNIRGLVSQSTDDSVIVYAVDLLKSGIPSSIPSNDALKGVKECFDKYWSALQKIKDYTGENLSLLKNERDTCRTGLLHVLKEYLSKFNTEIIKRKELIQKTIMDLESNSNAWMNVQLSNRPSTIEELLTEYNSVREQRWKLVTRTRENTNQKHRSVMNVFSSLQEQFFLNTSNENENILQNGSISKVEKSMSYSDKWNSAISDLGKAVDEEICMLTLTKDKNSISVIQCLLDKLDVDKEKIELQCDLYEHYSTLYNELCNVTPYDSVLSELIATKKDVSTIALHLKRFKVLNKEKPLETSKSEISPIVKELHNALYKEDLLMKKLAKDGDLYFPEINIDHPGLGLSKYLENKYLVKDWSPDYFITSVVRDKGTCSISRFGDEVVVIKEFVNESEADKLNLLDKAIKWNEVKSECPLKIKAVFYKDSTTYVMLPAIQNNLFNNPPSLAPQEGQHACQVLRQILITLKDLHALGVAHNSIHPMNILLENGKTVLDFSLNLRHQGVELCLKGINFQPASFQTSSSQTNDMYGFGCLVLWILFRNMTFPSTKEETPYLDPFRSIVEELLGPKDYALLHCLIGTNPENRPSAETLLNGNFLTKYENFCCARVDTALTA